jgi:hypothetical protein
MTMPISKVQPRRGRGQSLVEIALFLPILLLMIVGFVEIGAYVNSYITAVDASRAAARYVSPLDPTLTQCQAFGRLGSSELIIFSPECTNADYVNAAKTVKSWGASDVAATCEGYTLTNFFYVAGCMVSRSYKELPLDPISKTIWTTNDYPGDDVVVTTVPITAGLPDKTKYAWTWSLYGNQPSPAYPSYVISITNPATNEFEFRDTFSSKLSSYAQAPATGVVVVEIFRTHSQFTKLFTVANRLVGGSAILPDPIPIHTYSVFPLVAIEPSRRD